MSNSKAIGQFFGAFDPVNWHAHVIGGMDSINKPRGNFVQAMFIQKPIQFGLSVLAIGSGALAIIREIISGLGKLLVTPLTLAIGTVRVVTWSRFAQSFYNHLPGWQSLVLTAHRVMLQFTGIVCTALGGAFFLFNGTRFTVKCQINLGNYARYFPENKKAKQAIEDPLPAAEEPQHAPAAPLVPPPITLAPSAAVEQGPAGHPAAALAEQNVIVIPPAAPVATRRPVETVTPAENPKAWWENLEAIKKNQIKNWACKKDQIAVPEIPGLQNRLEALNQAAKPVAELNKSIRFNETHHYQVEACPANSEETLQFLKNLAQIRSNLVVTLSSEGDKWWKQKKRQLSEILSIELEKDGADHYASVLPEGTPSGSERIIKRVFALKQNGQVLRRITQYHYEGWKANTAPDPDRLNLLVDQIQGDEAPIVVQCANGRGASAVFIACHWLKYKVEEKERSDPATVPKIRIEKLILQMRSIHPGMVHEASHLQAIYKSLAKRFTPHRAVALARRVSKSTLDRTPQSVKTIANVAFKALAWGPCKLIGKGLSWWNGSTLTTPIPPTPATLHP